MLSVGDAKHTVENAKLKIATIATIVTVREQRMRSYI